MNAGSRKAPHRTLILGGGIAGLEALLAIRDLAADRTELTLVAPDPEFTYKPLIVEEPFTYQPAERHELEPAIRELGAHFVPGAARSVRPDTRSIVLAEGYEGRYIRELGYDLLVVCVGGRSHAAYEHAVTFRFRSLGDPLEVDDLLARAEAHDSKTLAFVIPPGVTWALPLYELALLTRRRAEESGHRDLRLTLLTPEEAPLILFGTHASEAVAELLRARGIDFRGGASVRETDDGRLHVTPGDDPIDAGAVAALPVIDGPRIPGLPCDEHGFIPIDEHARVAGEDEVYAAGDGTTFPIKQGGLGTQQADAAAEHIAARLGAPIDPKPFHPVLRGKLLTGAESLDLRHDLTGGRGEGAVSPDYLWWPPHKVGGRYLAAWLAHEEPRGLEPPSRPIEVEVALPVEWHKDPMALDPYGS
ncbi:MAG TPA: FAD-dependent oxidoreductase [Solirubrobacterales bacterium]|nr:FAD-dependent oxidoreductase [Solirubrobacterales bacterium]